MLMRFPRPTKIKYSPGNVICCIRIITLKNKLSTWDNVHLSYGLNEISAFKRVWTGLNGVCMELNFIHFFNYIAHIQYHTYTCHSMHGRNSIRCGCFAWLDLVRLCMWVAMISNHAPWVFGNLLPLQRRCRADRKTEVCPIHSMRLFLTLFTFARQQPTG